VNVPVPGEHGRWVFALPRSDGLVAIGITDVPAPGEPADEPRPSTGEEAELLEHASAALDAPLGTDDVVGRYAGLRPLAAAGDEAATADLSRRHAIVEDPESGALAIVGGKLTTYRRMAQDVVDRLTGRPCRTHRLPLVGAAPPAALRSVTAPERLVRRYGTEAPAVAAVADGRPELLEPVAAGVPVCAAELLWATHHELALTTDDLVDRRTRAGLVPAWRAATVAAADRTRIDSLRAPWALRSSPLRARAAPPSLH
jgi:glycerol-3-phosphate dehydrogenase